MIIGVLKERMQDENRVALLPEQVQRLVNLGHTVYVEKTAGRRAGYEDQEYRGFGALVVDRNTIYQESELILKVKRPLEEEYKFYRPGQVLFTYLHFDENIEPEKIQQIVDTGITGIAYEWVEEDGKFPLLWPMSELAGVLFARRSMDLLMIHQGVLGGKYIMEEPAARAMVVGVGHIGANVINVFLMNGLEVVIVDKHPETVDARILKYVDAHLWRERSGHIQIIRFDENEPDASVDKIKKVLPEIDILICAAVRRPNLPKEKCEFLVDRDGIRGMKKNSVVCDATACDKDFIETCISSDSLTDTYIEEGVVHYNCDHIPSLVPRTASRMLANATFPYVLKLSEGFEKAVAENIPIKKGVMCHRYNFVHRYSAEKKKLNYVELESIL
ncbi:TPA: hypothetical protein EYP66_00920 [Candidatus Poribacteria bacterium]|nr:hypothetical protein [Candidatus Poribacteria bacterium]